MAVTLSSEDWLTIYQRLHPGFDIFDPDGWDRTPGKYESSWAEEITQDEFDRRIAVSTCQWPVSMLSTKEAPTND
jgi:hypothetical protein